MAQKYHCKVIWELNVLSPQLNFRYLHVQTATGSTSATKIPLLNCSQRDVRKKCETERQLKSNVATKGWISNFLSKGTDKPGLRHAHRYPYGTKAKCTQSGETGWQLRRFIVDFHIVTGYPLSENEVFRQGYPFVNG
jgi:hypothetical protein